MRNQEAILQDKIIRSLKRKGWLVNKIVLCSNSGWPDIEAFRFCRGMRFSMEVVFIECKAKGKKLKPLQEYVHEQITRQGGTVYVIDTYDQFKALKL